jgi:hypothetical protein
MTTSGTGPALRRRRRHPASASRIVAAGVAAASTFGIVAVLGGGRTGQLAARPVADPVAASPWADGPVGSTPTTADLGTVTAPPPPITAPAVTPPRQQRPVARSAAS